MDANRRLSEIRTHADTLRRIRDELDSLRLRIESEQPSAETIQQAVLQRPDLVDPKTFLEDAGRGGIHDARIRNALEQHRFAVDEAARALWRTVFSEIGDETIVEAFTAMSRRDRQRLLDAVPASRTPVKPRASRPGFSAVDNSIRRGRTESASVGGMRTQLSSDSVTPRRTAPVDATTRDYQFSILSPGGGTSGISAIHSSD